MSTTLGSRMFAGVQRSSWHAAKRAVPMAAALCRFKSTGGASRAPTDTPHGFSFTHDQYVVPKEEGCEFNAARNRDTMAMQRVLASRRCMRDFIYMHDAHTSEEVQGDRGGSGTQRNQALGMLFALPNETPLVLKDNNADRCPREVRGPRGLQSVRVGRVQVLHVAK